MAESEGQLPWIPRPSIDTERLHLRTLSASDDDAQAAMSVLSDPNIMRWTSRAPVETIEDAKKWLDFRSRGTDVFNYAIELKSESSTDGHSKKNGKLIGMMGSMHWPVIGYMLAAEHNGKGYATEALKEVIKVLFEHMPTAQEAGYDYLEGCTDTDNKGSRRVLEKCGFQYCETHLQDFYNPTLKVHRDTAFYRMARPGKTLEELELIPNIEADEKSKFVPPIQ